MPATHDTRVALALAHSPLVDLLDEDYPERSPDAGDSEREVWQKAGERRLVRKLLEFRRQAEAGRR